MLVPTDTSWGSAVGCNDVDEAVKGGINFLERQKTES
jgi:hypothetical protein